MTAEEVGKVVRGLCAQIHEKLGIPSEAMRYTITVEIDPNVMPELGKGGVIISDVPTEVAARMSLDTMMTLFEGLGLEVGMLDVEKLIEDAEAEAKARPARVGAGRRPQRKRRGR